MFGIIGIIADGGGLDVDVTPKDRLGGGGPSRGSGSSCELCELDGGGSVESLV